MKLFSKSQYLPIYFLSSILLIYVQKPVFSECNNRNCIVNSNYLEKNHKLISFSNNENKVKKINFEFKDILFKEREDFNKLFSTILFNEENRENQKLFIDIESDLQTSEGNLFFAEGNVKIYLNDLIFKADKVIYDRDKKLFFAEGNVNLKKNKQYVEANILEYNFIKEEGYISNVYGALDFSNLDKDLNIINSKNKVSRLDRNNRDLINLPSEVNLVGSQNLRIKNKGSFEIDFSSIEQWRFKSKKIYIDSKKIKSDLIFFTNDPFNPAQLIVKSKEFVGEVINNKSVLKSRKTTLIFDNKINIPAGNRKISETNEYLRWGIGYDTNDKDGLYILRNFSSIEINNNLELDFTPYFLVQRAISGETDAFRSKYSSVTSDNVKLNDVDLLDYFALNTKISGKLKNWNLSINSDLKTLNTYNYYDGLTANLNLTRNLIKNDFVNESNYIKDYENKDYEKQFDLDLGIYAAFEKDDIYTALGTKIFSSYSKSIIGLDKSYNLIFDFGEFQGKSLDDNTKLIGLSRYGFITEINHNYKFNDKEFNTALDENYKNTPEIIKEGISLKTKLGFGIYEYSNAKSQSVISIGAGPSFVYGKLRKNFLDYTSASIFPEYVFKNGSSPFKFDDFNDSARIVFSVKQQLVGPLIVGFETKYNIDNKSSSYGNFENKYLSLEISRRAYSTKLVYDQDNESIELNFKVFNFGYKDNANKF